jgi:hypothetical protein
VSPVRNELGSYIPEDDTFIVTAVNTSNLTQYDEIFPQLEQRLGIDPFNLPSYHTSP